MCTCYDCDNFAIINAIGYGRCHYWNTRKHSSKIVCSQFKMKKVSCESCANYKPMEEKPEFVPETTGGYVVLTDGSILENVRSTAYNKHVDQGNWRKTREGAAKLRDYRAALQRVRKWIYNNTTYPQPSTRYTIVYRPRTASFGPHQQSSDHIHPSNIGYFSSAADVCRCGIECYDDLKIIFGV